MKKGRGFLLYFLLICILTACSGNNTSHHITDVKDSLENDKVDSILVKQKELLHNNTGSTIYQSKMLESALSYAEKNRKKDSFSYKSLRLTYDSDQVSMNYGHLFDSHHKYLLIRLPYFKDSTWFIHIFIYLLKDTHFTLFCPPADIATNMVEEYQGDTLQDINGDGYKDLILNWYSGCGCCPRLDQQIYLYNQDNDSVSFVELMNSTFLPNLKLTYQMSYGWPEDIALYKCVWRGLKLDTIEYVEPILSHKNMFRVTNELTGKIKTVYGLPKDYRCIDSSNLDWFLEAWEK